MQIQAPSRDDGQGGHVDPHVPGGSEPEVPPHRSGSELKARGAEKIETIFAHLLRKSCFFLKLLVLKRGLITISVVQWLPFSFFLVAAPLKWSSQKRVPVFPLSLNN